MKKLLIASAILLFASTAMAAEWKLGWNATTGAAGYEVSYKTLAATTYTKVDAGNVLEWTIPTTLVKGTRYEFFIRAYAGNPKSYSGESDHIRWTVPNDPVIIEIPPAPSSIIIKFE
jgi:hypothetical protein